MQLHRALEHVRLESWRQALEDICAGGIDLSTEIERVKTLEKKVAVLLSSEGKSSSDSEDGEGEILEGEGAIDDLGAVARGIEGTTSEGAVEGTAPVVD